MAEGRGREIALLGLLALLWGSSYFFIRIAVVEIPPLTLIAARVTIAAVFLTAVLRLRDGRLPRAAEDWRRLLLQAFLNSIGAWTLLAWGQQHIGAAPASVLNSTAPIFVFFITFFVTRHESTPPLRLIGACLGLAGVVLIVGVEVLTGLIAGFLGQLAALSGALLYAGAAIYGRRFAHLGAVATAAGTMIWASVVLIPLALIFEAPWRLTPSWEALAAAGVLGLFCTGVALMIYFRLLGTLGSLGTASQAYLRAGVGVTLGVVFLGETVTAEVASGLALAIIGVALINTRTRRGIG